jgi:VCBS repeat-containing protein
VALTIAGKFGLTATGSFSGAHIHEFAHPGHGDTITVSDSYLLFAGDYKRSGPDLILSKDGREQVVENYFTGHKHAALVAPDGARLSGDIVDALTGHVQYAQAAGAVPDAAKVIGHVTKLAGNATVIRNGVSIVLNMGDNVHKGDVVQSGSNSQLGITFIDGTVFGLASNARMVLNDMVYDPNGSSNSSFLSLVQGTITFLAGETAKHGDMKIGTPVATMGIRGTACLVEIDFDVQVTDPNSTAPRTIPVKFHVLREKDGTVGSYFLYALNDLTYSNPVATINRAGEVTAYSANGQFTVTQLTQIAPEIKAIIDQTLGLANNPNPQSNPAPGSTPADPVTPGTPKDTSPIKDVPVGTPTPLQIPINFPDPNHPGQIIPSVNVIVTVLKKIDVTPVVDKASFAIADQVKISDDNPSDVLTPFVAGSAKVQSVTGPAYTPEGNDLKNFVTVDQSTGHVSYDPAAFAFLKAGDTAIVTIEFDSSAGSDTFHESLTITINGVNDAPVIENAAIAVSQGGTVVLTAANIGVFDPDDTSFKFTVSNVTHATFQTTTDGVTWVDATTFTTADLAAGHVRLVHDGGVVAPAFSIQADDGEPSNHSSATVAGSVDFARASHPLTITATNAAIAELAGTGNPAPDFATGSINFADIDPAARPTVSTAFVSAVCTDGLGHDVTSSLTSAQMAAVAALETALSLAPSPANTNAGSVFWSYQTPDKSLDFLAKGETLTLNYTAAADDHEGGTASTPLSVTITGTNDAPVFTAGSTVTQLSVPADGVPFARGETFAFGPAMSSDGRFVVFGASDQIPGHIDSSHLGDVYLYDRLAGTYKWISDPATFSSSGITPHPGETYDGIASISLDGQYVAFKGQFQTPNRKSSSTTRAPASPRSCPG